MKWFRFPRIGSGLSIALAACVALFVASTPVTANAALIEVDSSFGVDSITRDTDTGLEWLDLRYTWGDVPDMNTRLAAGGDLFGWRRATTAEVVTFWSHAGISVSGTGTTAVPVDDPAYVAAVDALMENLGLWQASGSHDFTWGYTAEAGSSPDTWNSAWLWRQFGEDTYIRAAAMIWAEVDATTGCCEPYQNWLVREYAPVPEPSALLLLAGGVGLIGIGRAKRRRG